MSAYLSSLLILFFPWSSTEQSLPHMLTTVMLCVLIAFMVGNALWLLWRTFRIKSILSNAPVSFKKNSKFKSVWSGYEATIKPELRLEPGVREEGGEQYFKNDSPDYPQGKTFEDAFSFFGNQRLLNSFINTPYWRSVPGLLVGMGILGTFIGLSVGIMDFKPDSGFLSDSITNLLKGMKVSFITSVWGMALSIVFILYEKFLIHNTEAYIFKYCEFLNLKFKISKLGEIKYKEGLRAAKLEELFTHSQDNQCTTLASAMVATAEKMTSLEETFQLTSKRIENGMNFSHDAVEGLGIQISEAIHGQLGPALASLDHSAAILAKEKQETAQNLADVLTDKVQVVVNDAGNDFRQALLDTSGKHLEKLADTVKNTEQNLSRIPDIMNETVNDFQREIKEQAAMLSGVRHQMRTSMDDQLKAMETAFEILNNSLGNATVQFKDSLNLMAKAVDREVTAVMESTTEGLENAAERFDTALSGYADASFKSAEGMKELYAKTDKVSGSLKGMMTNIISITESYSECVGLLENVLADVKGASDNFASGGEFIDNFSRNFPADYAEIQHNHSQLITRIEDHLEKSNVLYGVFEKRFNKVQEEIVESFDHMTDTVAKFKQDAELSTNDFLAQFGGHLQVALGSLDESVQGLSGLSDVLVRYRRNM
jgi:hypothetical protein